MEVSFQTLAGVRAQYPQLVEGSHTRHPGDPTRTVPNFYPHPEPTPQADSQGTGRPPFPDRIEMGGDFGIHIACP